MSAITPALPTISLNPPIAALNLRSATSHLILSTHRRRRLYPPLRATEVSPDRITGNSEADKIVDGMEFGELCNEFECISSPSVEATARQLVRDILELREGNRALGTYAVSVKYKDPVRSFTGREKYKRPLWSSVALDKPTVHEELWDLSSSSTIAQAYFWASRRLFSTTEAAKDISDSVKNLSSRFSTKKENTGIYPDPTDPTKLALFLALIYFLVQFLRTTL
ncbi:hypothetical protein Ccrd_014173 [Cynara cardunculus var. scolymus]|uniref:Uncharacterized protein n=1 Tax=Cynara cardunculus var. scolymus TaxID=59895 RepID=A0A103YE97_CYNCS|nr:hypothetical protein Ccrd_014173 [Cynara cardunculus var. scolymus]